MTQSKYIIGKKYKIFDSWNGYSDAVVTVVSVSFDGRDEQILVKYEDGRTGRFETGSYIDSVTTPHKEEKTLVTEKVTKVIEAGDYGVLFIDEFKVGIDNTVTIELIGSVFTKEGVGKLIKTLNEVHEVM